MSTRFRQRPPDVGPASLEPGLREPAPLAGHPDDALLQGVADGSLRGPDGMAVRAHCDACPSCAAVRAAYERLLSSLESLRDPAPPRELLSLVLEATDAVDARRAETRQLLWSGVPALLVACLALCGWVSSAQFPACLADWVHTLIALRQILGWTAPVLAAARLPLALGSLAMVVLCGLAMRAAVRSFSGQLTEAVRR
jgi:hypothetical protein